jgi:hypothetical protein
MVKVFHKNTQMQIDPNSSLVWANNGDNISREYAGTSALKGDFTRTGKRNVTGMMNDASNSLTRMYHNTVRDFWRQATVDFVLGILLGKESCWNAKQNTKPTIFRIPQS